MKTFFSDSDGFSLADMEKFTLNILFSLSVVAILYKFLKNDYTDIVMVQFSLGIGSLLVFRKIGSYFKKDSYVNQSYKKTQQYNNYNEQSAYQSYSPIQSEQEFVVEPNQQVQPEQTISPKSSY